MERTLDRNYRLQASTFLEPQGISDNLDGAHDHLDLSRRRLLSQSPYGQWFCFDPCT